MVTLSTILRGRATLGGVPFVAIPRRRYLVQRPRFEKQHLTAAWAVIAKWIVYFDIISVYCHLSSHLG
jgi:hypothetical protein